MRLHNKVSSLYGHPHPLLQMWTFYISSRLALLSVNKCVSQTIRRSLQPHFHYAHFSCGESVWFDGPNEQTAHAQGTRWTSACRWMLANKTTTPQPLASIDMTNGGQGVVLSFLPPSAYDNTVRVHINWDWPRGTSRHETANHPANQCANLSISSSLTLTQSRPVFFNPPWWVSEWQQFSLHDTIYLIKFSHYLYGLQVCHFSFTLGRIRRDTKRETYLTIERETVSKSGKAGRCSILAFPRG